MKKLNIKTTAFISVDNTKTFEDKNLNELYVNEGEQAAYASKEITEVCKNYKIMTINILEEHPLGHISLAGNYKDKNVFDTITFEEVKDRTEENNRLDERAEFTVKELKKFLSEVGSQMLWPDHSIEGTKGVELSEPLNESDFDLKIIKGINPAREAYGGFDETNLDEELSKRGIKNLLIGGVATDYCVGKTALDGQEKGYQVYLINDAIRGVAKETTDVMMKVLEEKGIQQISTKELTDLLTNVQKNE